MAVKDHSLDDKIIKAAKEEFMEHGFRKASLHKIAEKAGITTGALYTRYKNKDALFCSLIELSVSEIAKQSEPIKEKYMSVQESGNTEELLEVIREEESIYLDMLFRHYDECVLFFCKSDGSSIEAMIRQMTEAKSEETVRFLKKIARKDIDLDGIRFIMSEQFHFYRQILERGYSKEKAVSCLETVSMFLEAGWKEVFQCIL